MSPDNLENSDRVLIIGKKDDITYINAILTKFEKYHDYIYLKVIPYPDLLLKLQSYYNKLRWLGIREIQKRQKLFIPSTKNPGKEIEVLLIKWEKIPRLKGYCEELQKDINEQYKEVEA